MLVQAWQLMFDSVDTANDCIRIATGVLSTIKINPKKMLAGLSPDMLATDLAEYLVRKGERCFRRCSHQWGVGHLFSPRCPWDIHDSQFWAASCSSGGSISVRHLDHESGSEAINDGISSR